MTVTRRALSAALLSIAAYGAGFISSSWNLPPGSWARAVYARYYWGPPAEPGFRDASDREPVACIGYDAVILIFGQSLAGNWVSTPYAPRHDVANFNLHDGQCYRARDPLLGPTGGRGTIWTRLADRLIEGKQYRNVLLVPVAAGGSSVADWTTTYRHRIDLAVQLLAQAGVSLTFALWQQGESDRATTTEAYEAAFRQVLAAVPAPVFIAVSTLCNDHGPNEAVRRAQRNIATWSGALAGPDTDQIDTVAERPDGCHLSDLGARRAADLWATAIRNAHAPSATFPF